MTSNSVNNSGHDEKDEEGGHYVVTAHPPGAVLASCVCSFVSEDSTNLILAKSQRLEIWQYEHPPPSHPDDHDKMEDDDDDDEEEEEEEEPSLNCVLSTTIHGRITNLVPFYDDHFRFDNDMFLHNNTNDDDDDDDKKVSSTTATTIRHHGHYKSRKMLLFVLTERKGYAVLSYNSRSQSLDTIQSGSMPHTVVVTKQSESGPLVTFVPNVGLMLHIYQNQFHILPFRSTMLNITTTNTTRQPSRHTNMVMEDDFIVIPASQRNVLDMVSCGSTSSSSSSTEDMKSREDNNNNKKNNDNFKKTKKNHTSSSSIVSILHLDSKSYSHVQSYQVILHPNSEKQKIQLQPYSPLSRTHVDGGSGRLIPISSTTATNDGLLILGYGHISHLSYTSYHVIPMPPCVFLDYCRPPPHSTNSTNTNNLTILANDMGQLITLQQQSGQWHWNVFHVHSDDNDDDDDDDEEDAYDVEPMTSSMSTVQSIEWLSEDSLYCASTFGDSQWLQLCTSSSNNNTNEPYYRILDQHVNLGPIVDFDILHNQGGTMVTASGAGMDGTLRLIRNGIGMEIYAEVQLGGIKGMWNISNNDITHTTNNNNNISRRKDDSYLIQSYVGETRVLGISTSNNNIDSDDEEEEATLEEMHLNGLDSGRSTLFAGNILLSNCDGSVHYSYILQITEVEVRILHDVHGILCQWSPTVNTTSEYDNNNYYDKYRNTITVATANESGQIMVSVRGGILIYLQANLINANNNNDGLSVSIQSLGQTSLHKDISCLDIHPFHNATTNQYSHANNTLPPPKSQVCAVGLWDDFSVKLLSLTTNNNNNSHLSFPSPTILSEILSIPLGGDYTSSNNNNNNNTHANTYTDSLKRNDNNHKTPPDQHNMMARSLCLVTLDSHSNTSNIRTKSTSDTTTKNHNRNSSHKKVNMLLVGLGDGGLISYTVETTSSSWNVHTRKQVSLGTRSIQQLVPMTQPGSSQTCVFCTGDQPTVLYLGSSSNKLCYSNVTSTFTGENNNNAVVNVATPFHSSRLFPNDNYTNSSYYNSNSPHNKSDGNNTNNNDTSLSKSNNKSKCNQYSLCVSNESTLRLGVIDDIQKLHVTTHKLNMGPRRVAHFEPGRAICVGCINDEIHNISTNATTTTSNNDSNTKTNDNNHNDGTLGNCIRLFDDTTLEELKCIQLDSFEMILSMITSHVKVVNPDNSANHNNNNNSNSINSKDTQESDGGGQYRPYIIVGTAFALPDEDEPSRGRVLIYELDRKNIVGKNLNEDDMEEDDLETTSCHLRQVTELQAKGGVYSVSPFYDGTILITVNNRTHLCQLYQSDDQDEVPELKFLGTHHQGVLLSLSAKSLIPCGSGNMALTANQKASSRKSSSSRANQQLAIVGDLSRSLSLIQYYPEEQVLEEVASDFNSNFTTACQMLTPNIYLGAESWNNIYTLKYNSNANAEEVRYRLDTMGEFHLGEMVNKFMTGTLVMTSNNSTSTYINSSPKSSVGTVSNNTSAQGGSGSRSSTMHIDIKTGSQTLYATVDGSIGSILGLDSHSTRFFSSLQRSISRLVKPVGGFSHDHFRAFETEKKLHPSRGFIDGNLIESFLDLDSSTMEEIVKDMNKNNDWALQDDNDDDDGRRMDSDVHDVDTTGRDEMRKRALTLKDVLTKVEEIAMLH